MNFEHEIQELQHRVKKLEHPKGFPMYESPKPLVFSEADNTPCTAELEVKLQKLATYFEKRAKENRRREEKHEKSAKALRESLYLKTAEAEEQHGYYFSGKADTYTQAAQKVRELLGEGSVKSERWVSGLL